MDNTNEIAKLSNDVANLRHNLALSREVAKEQADRISREREARNTLAAVADCSRYHRQYLPWVVTFKVITKHNNDMPMEEHFGTEQDAEDFAVSMKRVFGRNAYYIRVSYTPEGVRALERDELAEQERRLEEDLCR